MCYVYAQVTGLRLSLNLGKKGNVYATLHEKAVYIQGCFNTERPLNLLNFEGP